MKKYLFRVILSAAIKNCRNFSFLQFLSTMWKNLALMGLVVGFFACGDDSGSTSALGENGSSHMSSSTPIEDLDESSSSINDNFSSSVTPGSSSSVVSDSEGSSSSVKGSDTADVSSSSVIPDPDRESSSSSVKSSSSSAKSSSSVNSSSSVKSSSSVVSSSSKDVASSSSIYVPFDHSKTLGYQKFDEDGYKTFTDPRNGRSYYYITITGTDTVHKIASVTVMAENLNIGIDVPVNQNQSDDNNIERYCYNNDTTNCDQFGGLYQWAEAMQLPSRCNTESCADSIKPNHQGICPDGWRLFNFNDYVIVINAEGNDDGVKGMRSTYGFSGTNYSGFSLTGAGARTIEGGSDFLKKNIFWFYPQEHDYDKTIYSIVGYVSASNNRAPQPDDGELKTYGFSVRCTKLE